MTRSAENAVQGVLVRKTLICVVEAMKMWLKMNSRQTAKYLLKDLYSYPFIPDIFTALPDSIGSLTPFFLFAPLLLKWM